MTIGGESDGEEATKLYRPEVTQCAVRLHLMRLQSSTTGRQPFSLACHRRARLAADRHTQHEQAPASEPAAHLRVFCYHIDLCAHPPEQPFAGHSPKRGGQRCRQAELRSHGAWGQASGMLRQDVEDQRP
jgi:hypothetical protein